MKYYQIREFETAHPESHDGVVSEEELLNRLNHLRSVEFITSLQAIDILVNGEKEEEHE